MSQNSRWSYDPETRTVVIRENGEYQVGSLEYFVTVKVEVGVKDGKTDNAGSVEPIKTPGGV